jgi:hypothetical protein
MVAGTYAADTADASSSCKKILVTFQPFSLRDFVSFPLSAYVCQVACKLTHCLAEHRTGTLHLSRTPRFSFHILVTPVLIFRRSSPKMANTMFLARLDDYLIMSVRQTRNGRYYCVI